LDSVLSNHYAEFVEVDHNEDEEYNELHPRYWTNHGYVYSLGDGIIVVYGLYNVTAGEWFYLAVLILLGWLLI
jgi:F0F1-type ATP synthase alpha subunit